MNVQLSDAYDMLMGCLSLLYTSSKSKSTVKTAAQTCTRVINLLS